MDSRGSACWLVSALAFALCLVTLFWLGLRFVHHLPLPTSRTVEFAEGRVAVAVPMGWLAVGYSTDNPSALVMAHQRLPIRARFLLAKQFPVQHPDAFSWLRALGLHELEDMGSGRATTTIARGADAIHHLAWVDRGRLLHLQVDVEVERGAEWLPSVAADAEFLRNSVRQAVLNGDQDLVRREYDKWAPARESLRKIEGDLQLASELMFWALVVFVVVWLAAHWLFERRLKLGEIGYTWVGQATTLVSLIGLLLAAAALFSTRMEHRADLAESVTAQVAAAAAFHMKEQADLCPADWQVTIKVNPLLQDSREVSFDCTRFRSVMSRLAQHVGYAMAQIVKKGDFVDSRWVIGIPISIYIGEGDRIIGSAGLDDDQYEALSNRYMFFMEPLEQALRVVQAQSDSLATAVAFTSISSLWSICLAASLALGMVKLSGDRRIARAKQHNPGLNARPGEKGGGERSSTSPVANPHVGDADSDSTSETGKCAPSQVATPCLDEDQSGAGHVEGSGSTLASDERQQEAHSTVGEAANGAPTGRP